MATITVVSHQQAGAFCGNGNSSVTVTLGTAVDEDHSILMYSLRANEDDPSNHQFTAEILAGGTQIKFERVGTTTGISIEYEVIEFDTSVNVQHRTITYATSTTVGINAVTLSRSCIISGGLRNSGSTVGSDDGARLSLDSTTLVRAESNSIASQVIKLQVVEFPANAIESIQYIESTQTGTNVNVTIPTTVDTTKSIIFSTQRPTSAGTFPNDQYRHSFTDGDNANFVKEQGSDSVDLGFFVVEFTDYTVTHGTFDMTGATSDVSVSHTWGTSDMIFPNGSGINSYWQSAADSSDSGAGNCFTLSLRDTTDKIRFRRISASNAGDVNYSIIDWSEAGAGGVTVTDVDTDEIITDGQTGIVITGTGFEATQSTGSVTIDGETQTVTAWADTSITITHVRGDMKYGSQIVTVTNASAASNTLAITVNPASGFSYVDLTSVATVGQIITVAVLSTNDQLKYENTTTPGSYAVVVNADATFTISGSAPDNLYVFDVEAWDTSDQTWGTSNDQSVTIGVGGVPVLTTATETSITATTATVGAITDSSDGTLYYYISTSATPPSTSNLKDGTSSVTFGNTASVSVGVNSFNATGMAASTNHYTYFIQNDGASDSNILESGVWATLAADVAPIMPADSTPSVTAPSQAFGTFTYTNSPTPAPGHFVSGVDADLLSMNEDTGVLIATDPTDAAVKSTYDFTVTVTNIAGSDAQNVTMTIDPALATPVMPANTTGNVVEPGQTFGTFVASNTPNPVAVYTITGTDSGVLSINSSTGAVTADSPTDEGVKSSYAFTVTATNSGGADSQDLTITIVEASTGGTGVGVRHGLGIGL